MSFCPYRDIAGAPGTGFHRFRFMGFSIVDVLGTIGMGILLARYLNKSPLRVTIGLFILGIIVHRLFCVNTHLNVLLFGEIPNNTGETLTEEGKI
jgi:F0F1-type ATP synthase assembly protein I